VFWPGIASSDMQRFTRNFMLTSSHYYISNISKNGRLFKRSLPNHSRLLFETKISFLSSLGMKAMASEIIRNTGHIEYYRLKALKKI
jgi:hypothetical protein